MIVVTGDFNVHSQIWGNGDNNATGETVEECLNTT